MRACLLSCLQMALKNFGEIQFLLMLTACWLTYDTSQWFAKLEAANQAAWREFMLGLVCVCVCMCGLGTVIACVAVHASLCENVNVCLLGTGCVCVSVSASCV